VAAHANATQAAVRAGYSAKTARQIGEQNLTKPDIQSAITIAQQNRSTRTTGDSKQQREGWSAGSGGNHRARFAAKAKCGDNFADKAADTVAIAERLKTIVNHAVP